MIFTTSFPSLVFINLFAVVLLSVSPSHSVPEDDFKREDEVIVLDGQNFQKALKVFDNIMVEFYAPWCGHCKAFAPEYVKIARKLKNRNANVVVAKIDANEERAIGQQYGIQGFPTLKLFKRQQPTDYDGARSVGAVVDWLLANTKKVAEPKPEQLTSETMFKKSCGSSQLCVIAVLPHLYDCQSECRNKYIDRLKEVALEFSDKEWSYLWVEALAQPELEKALDIGGFGYPALVVVNIRKMAFSLMKGSFSTDGITDFLKDVAYGQGKSAPIRGGGALPSIEKTEKWDGKDLELPDINDEL
ncbi:Protein disulfide-isomerase A6-like protein [Fragariocoptes setiger]|uniref:protein disulfide-isomerase n=1 Tax=Fragariocoptes setiger TaxID=1670756 RepID=A0ABQ7S672_9ACAR|nr:Protein disulfide-isomerase A6-like protein [Fragariocoptes setiger]